MGAKLYIRGLAWATDDHRLHAAFTSFGELTEAAVIIDPDTGRSRGFGFVGFTCPRQAEDAIAAMDGTQLDGRCIRVSLSDGLPQRGGGFGQRGWGDVKPGSA